MRDEDFRPAMDDALREIDEEVLDEIDVAVEHLIAEWLQYGDSACVGELEGVPYSPEYVYRDSGEWTGWNDLFRTDADTDPETHALHRRHDLVEDIAYGRLMVRRNGVGPRNVRKKHARKHGSVKLIEDKRKT